jgi:DNA uptake protein ComE-like DNA-binding protein
MLYESFFGEKAIADLKEIDGDLASIIEASSYFTVVGGMDRSKMFDGTENTQVQYVVQPKHGAKQLKEVYGIDNELFEQIKPHFKVGKTDIRKININSDEIKQLTAHPYIDFQLAKALIRFRKDYGKDFQSAEEIRYIHFLSEQEAEKLIPYLKTND